MVNKYDLGYKYCPRCMTYYVTDRIRCPHCGVILRASPRKKSKRRWTKAVTPPEGLLEELSEVKVKVKRGG